MQKFFVDESQIDNSTSNITIIGQDVKHIANVLRLNVDDEIQIGTRAVKPQTFIVKIREINRETIICSIIEEVEKSSESNILLTIFQGIPKSDKMELIIQKGTELGVNCFVPIELNRCVVKLNEKDIDKKMKRWEMIAESAAKQSGRDVIPKIEYKINIKELCNKISDYDCVLVAYEQEEKIQLKQLLNDNKSINKIAIVVGPEGGFEKEEIDILKKNGAKVISLGNRILRTETAPIVLSSIIMYELGDIGGK